MCDKRVKKEGIVRVNLNPIKGSLASKLPWSTSRAYSNETYIFSLKFERIENRKLGWGRVQLASSLANFLPIDPRVPDEINVE